MKAKKVLTVVGGAIIGAALCIAVPELLVGVALTAEAAGASATAGGLLSAALGVATVGGAGGAVIGAGVGATINKGHDKDELNAKKEGVSETAKVYESKIETMKTETEERFNDLKDAYDKEAQEKEEVIKVQEQIIQEMEKK